MENVKKERRVGTLTFGIVLVIAGILLCFSIFTGIVELRAIVRFWPVVFIILGAEILIYSFKKDVQIKYDVWGILLTMFIVFSASLVGTVDYVINDVIFSDNLKGYLDKELSQDVYTYRFNNNNDVEIVNNGSVINKIKIIEDSGINGSRVHIEVKAKEGEYFTKNNYRLLIESEYDNNKLTILSGYDEKYIENGTIICYTKDKNLIKINGSKNMEVIK